MQSLIGEPIKQDCLIEQEIIDGCKQDKVDNVQ